MSSGQKMSKSDNEKNEDVKSDKSTTDTKISSSVKSKSESTRSKMEPVKSQDEMPKESATSEIIVEKSATLDIDMLKNLSVKSAKSVSTGTYNSSVVSKSTGEKIPTTSKSTAKTSAVPSDDKNPQVDDTGLISPDNEKLINYIMKKSSCDRITAIKSITESKNSIEHAVDIAKRTYRDTLPTISEYNNGIHLKYKNKESFYELKTEQGRQLAIMLAKGEFDRKLLGITAEYADVIYVDLKNENRTVFSTYNEKKSGKPVPPSSEIALIEQYESVLPRTLQFDEKYDTQFKLCYKRSTSICKISAESKLEKVYSYLSGFFNKQVKLTIQGEELGKDVKAEQIAKGFIVLYLEK